MRCVKAVVEDGLSQAQAVRTFGVGRTTLYEWLTLHRSGGYQALVTKQRGRPAGHTRLNKRQQAVIRRAVEDKHPDQLKLPFVLWTRQAVQRLIAQRYGITLSLKSVGQYLKRWGMTPQKPKRASYEQCDAAVRHWLDTEYPQIHKRAAEEKATIYWGDQMGLRSDHTAGKSYSPQGITPTLVVTGRRFSCHMMSAVANNGRMVFSVLKKGFNAQVLIDFLSRLIRHSKQKVFLILDGHPAHKAKKVKAWIAEREDQIELFFLPGYSPNLNPDEYLNQDLKATVFKHERPVDSEHMKSLLRSQLRRRQAKPERIKSFFRHPDVQYAA